MTDPDMTDGHTTDHETIDRPTGGAADPETEGPGLFARALAWARDQQWIVSTEDDEDGISGQALIEAPDEHPARSIWPTSIDMPIVLFVPDDGQRVAVYCLIVEDIEESLRPRIAEVATRANRGLLGGAFELDLDEGDLRFRSDLDLGGAVLEDDQLAAVLPPLLDVNLETVEVYSGAIVAVLTGRSGPLEAVREAEADTAGSAD